MIHVERARITDAIPTTGGFVILQRLGTKRLGTAACRDAQGGILVSEEPRVLLYIAAEDSHHADIAGWLTSLEAAGAEVAQATGHEAGRFALQTGVVSVLVLDQALGQSSCLSLLREGRSRNTLEAALVLRQGDTVFDEQALMTAGATGIYDAAALASIDLSALLPKSSRPSGEKKTVMRADRSKAFMAQISHEIRTPLHGIHGAMDLLEDTGMTPLQREYVQIVRNAADALMSVVNDLVDYSNPGKERGSTGAFPFEPRTCAERVAAIMGPKALAKGLDFAHLTHHEVPWRVKGDPNTLRQVLNGLTGHIIRHTGHGAVVMEIDIPDSGEPVAGLRFRIGVEAGEFGPEGPAGDGVLPYATDETDVSLERCNELVTQLGGQLHTRMTSTGTLQFEFSVSFEALPDKLPLVEVGVEALEGREVLVVDDTATNRMVYREQLANWGCEIVEASNGKEALERLSARASSGQGVEIALLDFAMQEMDGAELARAIRALPYGKNIRLVLCTSMPMGGDAARMTDAGFEAYLTKPVRFDCLRKVMCLLLGNRESDREHTPLITQHVVAEMDRATRSSIYIGDSEERGHDAIIALQNHGFPCDTAQFGDDADRALESHRYAAVLVDCRSSLDEGLATAARVRAPEKEQRIPLLMILRQADVGKQSACLAAGGDVVLVEPIQRDELVSVLRTYLGVEDPDAFDDPFKEWEAETSMTGKTVPNDAPVDLERLDEVTAGDDALRKELIEMFIADTEERFAMLESAIAIEDGEALNRTAHSINGSSANMGASTLQALAIELESLGSQKRFDEAPAAFSNLKNEYEVVKVFFGSL